MSALLSNRRTLLLSTLAGAAIAPLAGTAQALSPEVVPPVTAWMSWQGGVDLVAVTDASLTQPNVILHVARMVQTPIGSSASGMVFYQPNPAEPPVVMGFVSGDPKVGAYFGPKVFKGTPFETAPVLKARIVIDETGAPGTVRSKITVGKHVFEVTLAGLTPLAQINRPVGALPFTQQGLEAAATDVTLKVNGKPVTVIVPPVGMSGGPAAVWSPAGHYAR
ncbi:hypothetical protein ABAC460_21610 [Asticcacaulis sp. AC460]|uniref:hypothetical protein n=1 Tax=Asticcacaulis sp. AC460 TaxID=1282360 RepID=UPI0003C3C822|nr:hypothetical protein [Asticcacaulis sp. AC460]ESQ86980.1 hypothetical protein ABAC460_21610 [Asticcacaulis sp. AC460]